VICTLPGRGQVLSCGRGETTPVTMTTIGRILCRIGLHRWGRKRGYNEFSSNVIEWEQRCERCGKKKQWVEPKRDRRRD